MTKGQKITLAVFTAWPFLYMILFMCTIFGMMISGFAGGGHSSGPPTAMLIIFPLHFLTMVEIFALLVIYIMHVFKTDRVPQEQKALWAVVLFLGNMVAMPIYWYLYIWRKPKESKPEPVGGANSGSAGAPPE